MSTPASHTVHEVASRAEFDAVMDCEWAGFTDPAEFFWDIWFPVDKTAYQGIPAPDRAAAVKESKDRMWAEHKSDPASRWIYTTDASRGTYDAGSGQAPYVTSSCQWRLYKPPDNPFAAGVPDLSCPAWVGNAAAFEFTQRLVGFMFGPRLAMMDRPHVGLSWVSTRPEYRRRGLGNVLMDYGNALADRYGLEAFIEASDTGKPLYLKHGYRVVDRVRFDVPVDGIAQGAELKAFFGFEAGYYANIMWRPPHGKWTDEWDAIWKQRVLEYRAKQSQT